MREPKDAVQGGLASVLNDHFQLTCGSSEFEFLGAVGTDLQYVRRFCNSDMQSMNQHGTRVGSRAGNLDDLLYLLSNRRRRWTLMALHDAADRPVDIRAIAQFVASRDPLVTVEHVHSELLYSDLPKLRNGGYVEYDKERGMVRYTADKESDAVVESLKQHDSKYYAANSPNQPSESSNP